MPSSSATHVDKAITTRLWSSGSAGLRLASLLLLAGIALQAFAQQGQGSDPATSAQADATLDDGPYIVVSGDTLTAKWICDGTPTEVVRPLGQDATRFPPRCAYPDEVQVPASPLEQMFVVNDVEKLAVMSDLHGQFDLAVRLLQANGVIDSERRWAYGRGHLVVVGDCFDRGAHVTEVLWLLYGLQQQARRAGGDVNLLLGNHESMTLSGDLRYMHAKYATVSNLLERPYPMLYGEDTVLGRWIRTLPTIAKINGMLFVHGGISPEFLSIDMGLDKANAAYRNSLGLEKARVKEDPVLSALYDGRTSPIWYRGYFRDDALTREQLDDILARMGANRIIVGHTSMKRVETRFDGKVIAVDTSIKNGENGEMLLIEGQRFERGTLQGARLPLSSVAMGTRQEQRLR